MSLRPARPDDTPALAALHAASFDEPWTAHEIADLLSVPGGFALMASDSGGAAGFLLGRAIAGEAEILTLAVDPRRRRSGLGSALVEAAAAHAAALGAEALFLEVATDNEGGVALYKARGFQRAGFRPGYYRRGKGGPSDALVLRRDLTGP